MLLGEKLFWNVRAERFQYLILLRANTGDAELAAPEAGGAATEKRPAPGISAGPMSLTKLPVHSPFGSFSSSCLGGAFSFGGFALGALSLGAFSLVAGCGAFSVRGSAAGRAFCSRGGVEGRLAGSGLFGVAGAFPAGAAARASLGDMAGAW
jgi:hypothetical protein